jgi:anaerobic ribonucleoside-triphosphate reductase
MLNITPCLHLNEVAQKCDIERGFPEECCHCAGYEPGLTEAERTRCEVWTRVMGYHRPVSAFNNGKKAEHKERSFFKEPK